MTLVHEPETAGVALASATTGPAPVTAPLPATTPDGESPHLYELVRRRTRAFPAAVALGGEAGLIWRTINGVELLELTNRLAVELTDLGVREGDRVVLWLPNGWQAPIYHFALWQLGAIVVPFDREMNPEGGARILTAVEPRLIIVGYHERPAWAGDHALTAWWEPGSRRAGTPGAAVWRVPAEELAMIVFTSGTTGTPKGCMISHRNLLSILAPFADTVPLGPDCRLASILPLSHLFELTCGLLYPLAAGAAIHYIPSRRAPDILRVFNEQHITHMIAVPQLATLMGQTLDRDLAAALPDSVYRGLVRLAERLPFGARRGLFWPLHRRLGGAFRLMAVGGAALAGDTQRVWERFGVRVVQGYGTTECSPVVASGRADGRTPAGSVGQPLRGVEVRFSPEGDLLVRGPNVMRGYWREPAKTAEVLHDGWYATGDLARQDEAGNLYIIGRAKDLIVLPSGMNVWPQDVEVVLREDGAVKDAAVIAVPGPGGGARLHAYLVPNDDAGRRADPGLILAAGNARLAPHQRVATVSWWPAPDFPRTTTLKVRRHLLPPPNDTAPIHVASVPGADDPVGQTIAAVAHASLVRPEQTLASLGIDSLTLVDLALSLEEKTGRAVADGDLTEELTVARVRELLAKAPAAEAAPGGAAGRVGPNHQRLSGLAAAVAAGARWPYTWGRVFRVLDLPSDIVYRCAVARTTVLGGANLANLPQRVIFAGTHHSYPDMPLVRKSLSRTPARRFARRLVIAAVAEGGDFAENPFWAAYSILAFGTYPLQRHAQRETSLRGLAKLAEHGNALLIFPEGIHTWPEAERAGEPEARFRPGVAHLARAIDAVVVPFGLAGTELRMPGHSEGFAGPTFAGVPLAIHRGPVAIAYGQPMRFGPDESLAEFTARLQTGCYALTRDAEAALDGAARRA